MKDLISIVVPIYKVEKYLPKCIDSIINQTYKNLEIILVDDGSPDRCGEICDEYAKTDRRIKVIHKENGGASDARNVGIDIANGEYLGFVDSDDYIVSDMYEKLYTALKKSNSDMSICNVRYTWENNEHGESNCSLNIKDEVLSGEQILCEKMVKPNSWGFVVPWNKLYKINLFDGVRYPKEKRTEDEFIIHELLMQCDKIVTITDELYYYRQHDGSFMNQKSDIRRLDFIEAILRRIKYMLSNEMFDGIWEYYIKSIFSFVLWNGRLDKNNPEVKSKFKEIRNEFAALYRKTPKRNTNWKQMIHVKAFIISPDLYCKYSRFRNK